MFINKQVSLVFLLFRNDFLEHVAIVFVASV